MENVSRVSIAFMTLILASMMLLPSFSYPLVYAATSSFPTGITVFTKEKIYTPGQTVHLMGQMHSYSPVYRAMLVTVFDPDGQPYLAVRPEIGNPFFDFSFALDTPAKEGEWKAVIRYAADVGETKFIVTTSGLDKVIMTKLNILNSQGVEMAKEEQRAEKLTVITADLDNDSEAHQSFAFIIQIDDANGHPVITSFVLGSLAPLSTTNPAVNWTPNASGTYMIKAFVWNSIGNPIALTDKQVRTLEVLA